MSERLSKDPDLTPQKDEHGKPDFGSSNEATGSTTARSPPDILSLTTGSNNLGTTKPTGFSTSTSEGIRDPTSSNAGSTNPFSSIAGSTDPSLTMPETTNPNPNSTSGNGSNSAASQGGSNNTTSTNGTGNAAGSESSSTAGPGGASTSKPGPNQPAAGGAKPTPQPSPGGANVLFVPHWDTRMGTVGDDGLMESPARGGSNGLPFSDANSAASQKANITAIKIHHHEYVYRIQVCYGGTWVEAHGWATGLYGTTEETFYLQPDETITTVEVNFGASKDQFNKVHY
ncbi:hypothetical protein FS837_005059 [Tulasnella sp. UAMH 9824]|nr:hypothetical protein FS837_005059 [Tulasnella sp. UAMH 9824]